MRAPYWVVMVSLALCACSGSASNVAGDAVRGSEIPSTHATDTPPPRAPAPATASEPADDHESGPSPQETQEPGTSVTSPNDRPSMSAGDHDEEPGPGAQDTQSPGTTAAAAPRAPGTYHYDTDGYMEVTGGDRRLLPEVTTLTAQGARSGVQQAVRDIRDDQGRGQLNDLTTIYRDEGVLLSRVAVTTDIGGGVRDEREWTLEPAELLVSTGAEPGYRRMFSMRNDDTNAEVTVELLRREGVTVGGQTVEAVVTRIRIELSGSVEGTQTTVAWTRPSDLLTVQEHVESDVRNGPLRVRIEYRATLRSLEPSP